MAIKKENASLTANSEKLRNKKDDSLIRVRDDLKEKKQQKNYEAGIDPQDEQLHTVPKERASKGAIKPGEGNRLQTDSSQDTPAK
ncbi:hypothetical protein [Parapedobacter sp. 10938]|uniref:hypothetical protein n=1 Tax=Parapedobacter flavus TaxID=3110225 RepID=UPI002DBD913E|nr:hypothetical protein [Parapedobacter sp. 10938]MEC3878670.1 hypothetical protein [Parapedobacter sp. 10938]